MPENTTEAAPTQETTVPAPANDFDALIAELPDNPETPLEETPATVKEEAPAEEAPKAEGEGTGSEPAEPAPEEPQLPAHLRAMAQKEQELFQREQAAKQQLQQSQALQAEFLTKLKENPLEVLKEQGLSYEDLTRRAVADPNNQLSHQVTGIEAQLKQLAEQNAQLQQQLQAQEQARQDATYESTVASHLSEAKDDKGNSLFPLSLSYWGGEAQAAAQIRQRMEQEYKDSGGKRVLSVTEAAKALETQLENEIRALPKWRLLEILEQKEATPQAETASGKPKSGTATESLGNGPAGKTEKAEPSGDVSWDDILGQAEPLEF